MSRSPSARAADADRSNLLRDPFVVIMRKATLAANRCRSSYAAQRTSCLAAAHSGRDRRSVDSPAPPISLLSRPIGLPPRSPRRPRRHRAQPHRTADRRHREIEILPLPIDLSMTVSRPARRAASDGAGLVRALFIERRRPTEAKLRLGYGTFPDDAGGRLAVLSLIEWFKNVSIKCRDNSRRLSR